MKITLELQGEQYESATFADRHFFSFMAAFSHTSGLTLREMLNEQFAAAYPSADQFAEGMLKSYQSLKVAEEDLKYLMDMLFPTLESGSSLCIEDFMAIISQMGSAYAASKSEESPIEPAPISAPCPLPTPTAIEDKPSALPSTLGRLIFPPVFVELNHSELDAIDATAAVLGLPVDTIGCWYQWWRSIADADGGEVESNDAFDIIEDFSKGLFTPEESSRIAAVLLPQVQAAPEPIAA